MRTSLLTIGCLLLVLALHASRCYALDWVAFNDPSAFLLTAPFAKSIGELPAADKEAAIKKLHEALDSKSVEVRRRAALALADLGDKSGAPTMIADLATATGHDRDNVLVALRILKDDRAIPALRAALKDKSPYVRSIAVASLGELKAAGAYDEIVALTRDKENREGQVAGKKDGELNCFPIRPAESACYALGALGEQRATPVLIDLLSDKDIVHSAQQALEALTNQKLGADPEKWKKWWNEQPRRNPPVRRLSDIGTRHPRFDGEFYGWLSNDSFLLARPDHDHPRGSLFQRQLASGEEKPLENLTQMYNKADGGSILQISPDGRWVLWWTGKVHDVHIFGAKLDGSGYFEVPKAKADTDNLYLFWLSDSRRFVELAMPDGTKFTSAIVRSVDKPDVAWTTAVADASPLQAVCAIAGTDVAIAAGDRLIALPCSLHGYGSLEANSVIGESWLISSQPGADRTTPLVLPPKSEMLCGAALSPRGDCIAWLIGAKSDGNKWTVGLWLSKLDGSDWIKIGEEETVEPDMGFGDHLEKFLISAPSSPQWLPDGKTIGLFFHGDLYTVSQKSVRP